MVVSFGMYHGCAPFAWEGSRPSDTDDALALTKDRLCTIWCSDLFSSEKSRGVGAGGDLTGTETPEGDAGEGRGEEGIEGFKSFRRRSTMVGRRERLELMVEATTRKG